MRHPHHPRRARPSPLFLVAGLLVLCAWNQDDPRAGKASDAVAAFMPAHRVPAVSVAVVADGEIALADAYGHADLENAVPARPETVFRIASLTKAMTAVAALQLAETGALDLDAPVQRHCPAYPDKRWPLSPRQLLSHLGGVRHYRDWEDPPGSRDFVSIPEAVEHFADDPLLHEPGTRYSYSTFGYVLLGCVIEGASGTSYRDYMRRHVIEPAGMSRTRPESAYELVFDRARGYMIVTEESLGWDGFWTDAQRQLLEVGEIYRTRFDNLSAKLPAGGFLSTAADVARFVIALEEGRLLAAESVAEMLTPARTREGEPLDVGHGWFVGPMDGEPRVARLSGTQSGASAALLWIPGSDFAVVTLANLEFVDMYPLASRLGAIWGRFPDG